MMHVRWIGILLFVFLSMVVKAQEKERWPNESAVTMSDQVREIVDVWLEANQGRERIRTWRVLVTGVQDRRSLNRAIEKFEREFPDLEYEWNYEAPIYKLKVGSYANRWDCKSLFHSVKEHFPTALEIRDWVRPSYHFNWREQ